MSERKSWDIAPRPRKAAAPMPAAASRSQAPSSRASASRSRLPVDMVRPARPSSAATSSSAKRAPVRARLATRPTPSARPAARSSRGEAAPPGRLRERRQKARKAARITMTAVALIAAAGSVYALWLPQLRVQEVVASGINAEAIESIAQSKLIGTFGFIVPKDSIFFFPEQPIRDAVLAQFPDVAEVDIARSSPTSLEVIATPRAKAFIWCGTSFTTPFPDGTCFEADGGGLIYRASGIAAGSSSALDSASSTVSTAGGVGTSESMSDLRVYGPLDAELEEGQWPIGLRVSKAASMPDVLKLVDAIISLNVPIVAITLRDDEADLWVNDATRITYVVGREQGAAKLAASVIPTLDLTDGTIQYLDLRFNGKAYLKRYGE